MVLLKFAFILFTAFIITSVDATWRKKHKSPCANGKTPLKGYFCGRTANRKDCPSNYECVIASNDAYAVCCPLSLQGVTKTTQPAEKPGSCPKPATGMGICIARCTYDSDCADDLKCCGSCPRDCIKPGL